MNILEQLQADKELLNSFIEVTTIETGKKDIVSYMSFEHFMRIAEGDNYHFPEFPTEQEVLMKLSSGESNVLHNTSDGKGWSMTTYFRQHIL